MRMCPGSIKDDLAAISYLLVSVVAAAATSGTGRGDAFVSTCRCLLIPSTFVSGQRRP